MCQRPACYVPSVRGAGGKYDTANLKSISLPFTANRAQQPTVAAHYFALNGMKNRGVKPMQTYPTGYAESHRMVEQIFREILPRRGMAVREEQIALCHEVLDTLYTKHWWWTRHTSSQMPRGRCTRKLCLRRIWMICAVCCNRHISKACPSDCGRYFSRSLFPAHRALPWRKEKLAYRSALRHSSLRNTWQESLLKELQILCLQKISLIMKAPKNGIKTWWDESLQAKFTTTM